MSLLAKKEFNEFGSYKCYEGEFQPIEVQGAKELEVLCPTSKLTGFPMSMQQAIMFISDKNSRLADVLFQELPAIHQDDKISDTDKLRLLVSRLDTGSFAENDHVAEAIGKIAKEFFPEADVEKAVEQSKIVFDDGNKAPEVNE